MTGKEAREFLINISYELGTIGIEAFTVKDGEKMRDAIEALEQEPIIDKIRAEIIEMRSRQNVGALECLDIIDKYKTESEGKE